MKIRFTPIAGNSVRYWGLLGGFGAIIALGMLSSHHMETHGHWITGMSNQVVWGLPHVFAVFLIVAASGALNIASISSVFGKTVYKPLSRLSALLALTLLLGGLAVLVLDLGRPDRLVVAMTKYNLKSIFAWNMILYNGFFLIVGVYLWMMMEKKMNKYTRQAGFAAFIWRLILTTGTGSIFGFLVARQGYDAALFAPMFIVMSFAYGAAIFILVMFAAYNGSERKLGDLVVMRLKNLLGVFVASALYFVLVFHLTNLYATEHHGFEGFILLGQNGGGVYATLFWLGQVLLGGIVPLLLLYLPATGNDRNYIMLACVLVVLGGLAQMYVTIIGGQAYPLILFPGMEVSSNFNDGIANTYAPSIWEFMLGITGLFITFAAVTFAIKILPFLPESLADSVVDPHHHKDNAADSAKA
jgi:molybdopterin-containing oxidoreductase family membrane subunit